MTDEALIYKPEAHEYWWCGVQIPGITTILRALGYDGAGASFYTANSRQKGTAVHLACDIADTAAPELNDLDEVLKQCFENLHPDIVPYLAGYLLFRKEMQYRPLGGEQPLVDRELRVCGKPDSWGDMRQTRRIVLDRKTWKAQGARPKRSSEIQTACYKRQLRQTGINVTERWVLKLSGNGKYRAYRCDNPRDEELVCYAAHLWWDLRNNKLVSLSGDVDEEVAAIE